MNTFFLLDVPYSGGPIFLNHYEKRSNGAIKRFRDNISISGNAKQLAVSTLSPVVSHKLDQNLSLKSIGMMICDPAERLARAYIALQQINKINASFEEYYSDAKRTNLFCRILGNRQLQQLGFVGVFEQINRSLRLASEWFSLAHKLGHHHALVDEQLETFDLLTPEHRLNIEKIHAKDYELYKQASDIAKTRVNALYPDQTQALSKGKRIVIHVGPPKTGTSAIQVWLLENRDKLKKAGIYYPNHKKDDNEVSSGNFLSILSKNQQSNKYDVDLKKLHKVLSRFEKSDCDILLLSSEHFHNYLVSLFCYLPNADYIFYMRHPLSSIESSYHQAVKRHGETGLFTLPAKITFNHLLAFLTVSAEFATSPIIRFYDTELRAGKSLVADFAQVLGFQGIEDSQDKRVNPRFGFGELELMRACNQFVDTKTVSKLDLWLQKQSLNKSSFTLIKKSDLERSKQQLSEQLTKILLQYRQFLNSPELINRLTHLSKLDIALPYKNQAMETRDLALTWQQLKTGNVALAHKIIVQYRKANVSVKDSVKLSWSSRDRIKRFSNIYKLPLKKS